MEENKNVVQEAPAAAGAAAAPAGSAAAKKGFKRTPKRKVCLFCQEKVEVIDFKDVQRLKKFVTESGKMLPRRMSGTCAKHQRELSKAIKRARVAALLPFKAD